MRCSSCLELPAGLPIASRLCMYSRQASFYGQLPPLQLVCCPASKAIFVCRLILGAGESLAYPCYSRLFADIHPARSSRACQCPCWMRPPRWGRRWGQLLAVYCFCVLGGGCFSSCLVPPAWYGLFRGLLMRLARKALSPRSPITLFRHEPASGPLRVGNFFGHFCGNYFWFFLLTWIPSYLVKEPGMTHRLDGKCGFCCTHCCRKRYPSGRVALRPFNCPWRFDHDGSKIGCCHGAGRFLCNIAGCFYSEHIDLHRSSLLRVHRVRRLHFKSLGHHADPCGPIHGGALDKPSEWNREYLGDHRAVACRDLSSQASGSSRLAFVISAFIVLAGALFWGFIVGRVEQVDWDGRLECRS